MSYVSPTQINALIPSNAASGQGQISIVGGLNVPAISVLISPVSPAFFLWSPSYVSATHLDTSLAVKAGLFPNIVTVPAKPGEGIFLLGTGFGPTTPVTPVGQVPLGNTTYLVPAPLTVTIGGIPAQVVIAKLAAGQAGLYQIMVAVPSTAPNGDLPVVATIGGVTSPTGVLLTVQK